MGAQHITSDFVSQLTRIRRDQALHLEPFLPEISFLKDLTALPRSPLSPRLFNLVVGWCSSPLLQNGYEGPFMLLNSYAGRGYVLTQEGHQGHLCMQAGTEAQLEAMCQERKGYFDICFGRLPFAFSGAASDVVAHLRRDILDNRVVILPENSILRTAWMDAVAGHMNARAVHDKRFPITPPVMVPV